MQATETSTAVRHDVEAIAQGCDQGRTETLLVVDGITGLGTTHFDVDGWGIDVLIGGSQKAVMIPPGLAYLSVSEKAWAAMETSKNPRYYFDLRKERKNAVKGESAYTPAVALVAGLGAALDYIAGQAGGDLEKGRDRADRQRAGERGGHARGPRGARLHALCAHGAGGGSHGRCGAGRHGLGRGGEGAEVEVRAGHRQRTGRDAGQDLPRRAPGLLRLSGYVALLGAMEHIAKDTLGLPVKYGQAVAAAQEVYAKAAYSCTSVASGVSEFKACAHCVCSTASRRI